MMHNQSRHAGKLPMIVLMGLRGSGKSTIAGHLAMAIAGRAGRAVDLDDVTAAMLRTESAGDAARTLGWPAFRAGEYAALQDCLSKPYSVLALGGGTPTYAPSRELLERGLRTESIVLVYLHATPGVLQQRLAKSDLTARPSLTGGGVLEEIAQVYSDRDGLYRRLASPGMVIEADQGVDDVVRLIAARVKPINP